MWAAGVVLGLSVTVWVVSLYNLCWVMDDSGWMVGVGQGCIGVFGPREELPNKPGWYSLAFSWSQVWMPRKVEPWGLAMPLWMPVLAAGAVLGRMLYTGARAVRRTQVGHCPTCGYDLTGIDGVCPECGGQQQRTEPPPRPRPNQQRSQR